MFSIDSRQIIHPVRTEKSKSIPCPAAHLRISHIREYLPGKGSYRLLPINPDKPGTEFRLRTFSIYRLSFLTAAVLAPLVKRLTAEWKVAGSIPGAGPILRVLK